MTTLALAVAALLSAAEPGPPILPSPGVVDGPTAQRLVAHGITVVDVRTPEEFAEGHVPGALNIPFDQIAARAGEVGRKERPVLLYCRTGRRSGIAAGDLSKLGFTAIYDMQSMSSWPGAVEKGPPAQAPAKK